jgi:FG-GAP-like repeat
MTDSEQHRGWIPRIGLFALIAITITASGAEARQFKKPAYYKAGTLNWTVITGDFNHDGNLDLVTGDHDNSKLYVFLGKGDGTFRKPLVSGIPVPTAFAVGDFNGDHIPDFATIENYSTLAIYLSNGDGTFRNSGNYDLGGGTPVWLTVADFNGDGHADIAVTNYRDYGQDGSVMVFFGKGNGRFGKPVIYKLPNGPAGISAADFNGDHRPDLAVTEVLGNAVAILMNDGRGHFKLTEIYNTASNEPTSVTVAALKSGGNADLIVSCATEIIVFPGNGDGTFGTPTQYFTNEDGNLAMASVVADFNGDGNLDVATAFFDNNVEQLFYGNGDGTLQKPVPIKIRKGEGGTQSLVTADFNKDGAPDLVFGSSPDLAVLLNAK